MTRPDPTIPYYARNITNDSDEVSIIVREILRFIKQVNPALMMTWGVEDTTDAIQVFKDFKYTAPMLSLGFNRLRRQAQKQKVDFLGFYQIMADIAEHWEDLNPRYNSYHAEMDWREKERLINKQHLEREALAPKIGSSAIKKYWMEHIKADLKKAGIKSNSGLGKIVANL